MREIHLWTAISILVHSSVILLLMATPFTMNRPVKVLEIDFSLMKGPAKGAPPKVEKGIAGGGKRILEEKTIPRKMVGPDRPVQQNPETVPEKGSEPLPLPTVAPASEARGETVVQDALPAPTALSGTGSRGTRDEPAGAPETGPGHSGPENPSREADSGSAGGAGNVEGGDSGTGKGGGAISEEGKDFSYIRDAVMKNIGYPERARRMGLEGKTLLTFMVLEDGTTGRIRVEKSSGCPLLDDCAKEGIARTVISRRVPYRIVVRLPITFTLRISGSRGREVMEASRW
ncbi:MAG: TonB family protein [Deltaproteobacteria bacterium]|nr:TonB family protein [Deltaproteobacteria bacterium]